MQIQAITGSIEKLFTISTEKAEVPKMTDCMCRGCYAGSGASLHYIPKDPDTRQKWIDFIYKNRTAPKLKNVDRIRICSAHFTEECFTNYRQKMMGFGKRLILKPNAVPTIAVQQEFIPAPSRTRRVKLDEITAETRLCPLCQRRQKDSDALSLHLTKKHSVHPACLDNLLVNAPYAIHSTGTVKESIAQSISTSQHKSSENNKSPLMAVEQDGSSREKDACDESRIGYQGSSHGDTEASVKDNKSNGESNAAADGIVNHPFKCHSCLELFTQKSALNVHYNSATHIQKVRAGAGIDSDSPTPILAYPYVSTKPYQCDVCHVSYFYAFGLESHLKSVLHQSRTRKAGNTAPNSKTNTENGIIVANLAGTRMANVAQIASAKTCNCVTQAEKVELQPTSTLLPAQALPTVLPLLTLPPNSVPHSIVPSVFPQPGTSTQMLMPIIVNGLHTQSATPDGPQQILQQAVPVLGLCSAQQVQGLGLSDIQSQSAATGVSRASRIPLEMNTPVDGVGVKVKIEIKEEPCDQEISQMTPCTADATIQTGLKQEYNRMGDDFEDSRVCGDKQQSKVSVVENSNSQQSDVNIPSTIQDFTKSSPANCSHTHGNLVLMPSNTKACSSMSSEPPELTEFQSQVLWAFFESRNEAESEIPPGEDCEALGREVGLTENEVRKWLVDMHQTKDRHHADVQSHYDRQGSTEDDEDALMIDESGGTVLRSATDFLSDEDDVDDEHTTINKKRKRGMEKEDSEEESGFLPSFRTS